MQVISHSDLRHRRDGAHNTLSSVKLAAASALRGTTERVLMSHGSSSGNYFRFGAAGWETT